MTNKFKLFKKEPEQYTTDIIKTINNDVDLWTECWHDLEKNKIEPNQVIFFQFPSYENNKIVTLVCYFSQAQDGREVLEYNNVNVITVENSNTFSSEYKNRVEINANGVNDMRKNRYYFISSTEEKRFFDVERELFSDGLNKKSIKEYCAQAIYLSPIILRDGTASSKESMISSFAPEIIDILAINSIICNVWNPNTHTLIPFKGNSNEFKVRANTMLAQEYDMQVDHFGVQQIQSDSFNPIDRSLGETNYADNRHIFFNAVSPDPHAHYDDKDEFDIQLEDCIPDLWGELSK
ncbi:TPA: hypothetical protein ACTXXA_003505 [Legionella anisa]